MTFAPESSYPETSVRTVRLLSGQEIEISSTIDPLPDDWLDPRYYHPNGDIDGRTIALVESRGHGAAALVDRAGTEQGDICRYWLLKYNDRRTGKEYVDQLPYDEFGIPLLRDTTIVLGNNSRSESDAIGITSGEFDQYVISAHHADRGVTVRCIGNDVDVQLAAAPQGYKSDYRIE
ncbi:MAG TPA: hypothetical protein VMB52_04365 [Verrucomicrobiae bacterium]|nr:hypothetical protein [Verrucomicrobiae bacterium]